MHFMVDPRQAMVEKAMKLDGNNLIIADRRYSLNRNVHIVAFGKAVIGMVKTAEDILGEHVVGGVASVPWGIQVVPGLHIGSKN